MNHAYAHTYRQNSVQTASPSHLILMLFDGALRFMNRALQGFEESEVVLRNETIHVNLLRTQAILDELQASLNLETGGEFARNMSRLYDFMRGQIRAANLRKEPSPINVVIELLGEIRGAWSLKLAQTENHGSPLVAWAATAA